MDAFSIPDPSADEVRKARQRVYDRRSRAKHRNTINARKRASRAANTAKNHARYVADRQANPEKYVRYGRTWRAKHPARARELDQRWKAANKAQIAARDQARRLANPGLMLQRQRRWMANNSDYVREHHRNWSRTRPDLSAARHARRLARKLNAPRNDFTATQWRVMCRVSDYRCCYCDEQLSLAALTPDHLTPYADNGSNTLWNILPCCRRCNSRKKDRGVLAPVQPFLLLEDE